MNRMRDQGGFTLMEMVFVLAVVGILASIFLPLAIDLLDDARLTQADVDVAELATALSQFLRDMRHYPTCNTADCDPINGTGPGDNNNLKFLRVGESSGVPASVTSPDPTDATGAWNFALNQEPTPARNNTFNHLVVNNPNADGIIAGINTDYSSTGTVIWRGAYVARLHADPWGNNYIISVGAMEASGSPIVPNAKGWILSAGPNGVLETAPTDLTLGGDDRGILFFTAR
ncbi:MAG: prepilin-type N-terminal cleavage/methylation domain-containing protein [Candidatus Rokubacteria bacterium]|nr:prepilin-type N-terminal cleavage/methylation domain-containing protein [Candidatus Rokubacteria bacterium]